VKTQKYLEQAKELHVEAEFHANSCAKLEEELNHREEAISQWEQKVVEQEQEMQEKEEEIFGTLERERGELTSHATDLNAL
jgi:hypothetical protein